MKKIIAGIALAAMSVTAFAQTAAAPEKLRIIGESKEFVIQTKRPIHHYPYYDFLREKRWLVAATDPAEGCYAHY